MNEWMSFTILVSSTLLTNKQTNTKTGSISLNTLQNRLKSRFQKFYFFFSQMHLYVQVHLKEVNRNFPFALSGPFKWGKWHLASLDLNGTEPWLASGVNTCVIPPVSHRPCVLWVQPSTPSLTHCALLFWQDLAEPNKADSCLFVRPPAFAVCVYVCVTGPSVMSGSAAESGGCQVAPRGMVRWNTAETERGALKVVCAQSLLACVLVRMSERVDRRPARWASIASRCWSDDPAAGLWLKRFHPSEETANL